MMQLILIFLCTTLRGSNYYISLVIRIGLFSDLSQSFESAFIKLASADNGLAIIEENIILYIQLFIFIMFFIQNIYDNKHSYAWPFFVLKFVVIRKYNNLIAVCKNVWFHSQIKKIYN